MSKFDVAMISIVAGIVGGMIYFLIMMPKPETAFYKDQGVVCNTEDFWGINNAKTTCYKVEEITK